MNIGRIFAYVTVATLSLIGVNSAQAAGFRVTTTSSALLVSDGNYTTQTLDSDSNSGGVLRSLSNSTGLVPSAEDLNSSGSASASASLATGKIKLFGQAEGPWGAASASGFLADTLYFNLPDGMVFAPLTLTMTLTGTFSEYTAENGPWGTASLVFPGDPQSIVNQPLDLFFPGVLSSSGLVQEGIGYRISASLFATTEGTSFFDLTNTATLDLILPEGVTFTSDSQVFLSERQPSAVPEPSTSLLLFGGLTLVLIRSRWTRILGSRFRG